MIQIQQANLAAHFQLRHSETFSVPTRLVYSSSGASRVCLGLDEGGGFSLGQFFFDQLHRLRTTIAPQRQLDEFYIQKKMQAALIYNTVGKTHKTNSLDTEMSATGYFDYAKVRSPFDSELLPTSTHPCQRWSESGWSGGHGGAQHCGASPGT